MTSWVITIDKGHPQHWAIARRHSFWDMTKFFPIGLGDTIYFWQAGGSMIAQCRAATSAFPITPEHPTPWKDSGDRLYRARVSFAVISEDPTDSPRWGELQSRMSKQVPLQAPREFTEPGDESVLASLFSEPLTPASFPDEQREQELARLGFDLRTFDLLAIARRQGQSHFRNRLIDAYEGSCAVTKSSTIEVLEAAHISPYLGKHTNGVHNGLLLRSDIHTLFDLQRLTVLPTMTISVHPELRGGAYGDFHGRRLAVVPADAKVQPSRVLLEQHNAKCHWL